MLVSCYIPSLKGKSAQGPGYEARVKMFCINNVNFNLVTHEWFQLLESTTDIGVVFFDFKKAFDMVPHMPLMSKLEELNLDHHVLANRHQRVTVNGATSESTCVT